MNEKQITIICITLLVVFVLVGGGLLYYMEFTTHEEIRKQIAKVKKEVDTAEKNRRDWPGLDKENAQLKADIDLLAVRIPIFIPGRKPYEMDTIVDLIDGLRKSSNVYISSGRYTPIPTGAPPLPGNVQKVTYDFSVRGGWFNLLRFINMLETTKRVMNVDSIIITPGGGDEKLTSTPRRDLTIRVTSYMYREGPPPPDPNAPPETTPKEEIKDKPAGETNKSTLPPD